MGMTDTIEGLSRFEGRGAGTNAERRAALYLADQLRTARREADIETFWSRPNSALAAAWHTALAVAGSLLSVASATAGAVVIIVALVSILLDALTGWSPGRRLTREHASQNVVSPAPADGPPVRLVITAHYDAGRMGLVHRPALRRPAAALRNLLGPLALGWQAVLTLAIAWLLVLAVARHGGAAGTTISILQIIPTAGLVVGFALLLELSVSTYGPSANDNAAGTALAIQLTRALDAAPPRRLAVELVLQGASDGSMAGLRHHLRARRRELVAGNTIVLGIAASGTGEPRYWSSDGPLIPLRALPRLRQLATEISPQHAADVSPQLRPYRGRGVSPAYPARLRRRPAITVGGLDRSGLPPHSHLPSDTPRLLTETEAADRLLELTLTLVDAIDADLPAPAPRPQPAGA
jgi:hypothetical protein